MTPNVIKYYYYIKFVSRFPFFLYICYKLFVVEKKIYFPYICFQTTFCSCNVLIWTLHSFERALGEAALVFTKREIEARTDCPCFTLQSLRRQSWSVFSSPISFTFDCDVASTEGQLSLNARKVFLCDLNSRFVVLVCHFERTRKKIIKNEIKSCLL